MQQRKGRLGKLDNSLRNALFRKVQIYHFKIQNKEFYFLKMIS